MTVVDLVRRIRGVGYPIALALVTAVATFLIGFCSGVSTHRPISLVDLLSIWKRWDAIQYLLLAEHGYGFAHGPHENLIVLMPLYPASIWLAQFVVRESHLAGILVANLFCIGAFIYLFLLVRLEANLIAAQRAVFFLAIFPTAFFLHLAYSESMFLFFSVAAFYHARRERWWIAGIAGALAAAARIPGAVILPALVFEYFYQRDFRLRELRWNVLWLALIPLGALAYLWINFHYFGHPFHFLETQKKIFSAFLASPVNGARMTWWGILHSPDSDRVIKYGGPFLAFIIGTGALCAAPFLLRPVYACYLALNWILIFCNNLPFSSLRYLLVVFPLYLLAARLARRAWLRDCLAFASMLAYAVIAFQFSRGWWAY